ncbi:MAG: TonB family protein [Desulfomicrobium sp.]
MSVLCATLIHALILSAIGSWLGMGGKGTGGPMLMALELSGGGNGPGMQAGASPGTPKASKAESAVPSSDTKAAASAPKTAAPAAKVQDKEKPSPPPTVSQPRPKPVAKIPARPEPSVKTPPTPIAPQEASAGQAPSDADSPQTARGGDAALSDSSGQDASGSAGGLSETASRSGNARRPQGNGSGAPGNGGGAGTGGGGDSGAGDKLIRFNSPGGPGIVRMARPRYPREARRLGKEGVVVLKLSLDATGAVHEVEVLRGVGFGMEEASREAVFLSRFRPATFKGRPVACQAILPIHFKLR